MTFKLQRVNMTWAWGTFGRNSLYVKFRIFKTTLRKEYLEYKARLKRRTWHVPNLKLMIKIYSVAH